MPFPKVGIVIPHWNGKEVIIDCLRSIGQSTYPNYMVIVVDNGSSDDSADVIQQLFPEVMVVRNPTNLGVAKANSQGITSALELGSDYVLLLNNDTVVDPDAIKALVEVAERKPNAGALCSKVYYFDSPNIIWSAGASLSIRMGYYRHLGYNQIDNGIYSAIREVNCAPSCALLIPRHVFEHVGLWDAGYFMYADDTDFCLRVQKNGYQVLLVPSSKVWHKVSFSSGGTLSPFIAYYVIRNILFLLDKYAPMRSKTLSSLREFNVVALYCFTFVRSIINVKQTVEPILDSGKPFLIKFQAAIKMLGVLLISPLVLIRHASEFKPLMRAIIRAVKDFRAGIRGQVNLEA